MIDFRLTWADPAFIELLIWSILGIHPESNCASMIWLSPGTAWSGWMICHTTLLIEIENHDRSRLHIITWVHLDQIAIIIQTQLDDANLTWISQFLTLAGVLEMMQITLCQMVKLKLWCEFYLLVTINPVQKLPRQRRRTHLWESPLSMEDNGINAVLWLNLAGAIWLF
jgi:hypothetical protein